MLIQMGGKRRNQVRGNTSARGSTRMNHTQNASRYSPKDNWTASRTLLSLACWDAFIAPMENSRTREKPSQRS
jgi:hypothetical protein